MALLSLMNDRKEFSGEKVGAIIAAAGESKRMGGVDKVLALLGGKPIL